MRYRNPFVVFLLPFVTLGIYQIVWAVKTKSELNDMGAQIPSAWLVIIPFVNIWWLWKFSEAAEEITEGANRTLATFFLLALTGSIGMAVVQSGFNRVAEPADALKITISSSDGTPVSVYRV